MDNQSRNTSGSRILRPFTELFGLSRGLAALALGIFMGIAALAIWYFIHLGPPKVITISAGPEDSSFWRYAKDYQLRLASNHISVRILTSQGSQENLQRLTEQTLGVDLAFVQSGITNEVAKHVVSLGSVAYQPLLVFYRADTNLTLLSQFKGKRLAVGAAGSGTRILATSLLASNAVTAANTTFLDAEASAAAQALLATNADAVFLTGDSAPRQVMTNLLRHADIRLFSFSQAEAYARRISYLNKVELPMGSLDFAANLPRETVYLVAPTVELLGREKLHPALVDLVIEEAKKVHGKSSILARKEEFPKPLKLDVPISAEAARYYNRGGKSLTYNYLPFWLANIVNRVVLVFIPAIVLLVPALRLVPKLLQWKTKLKLYRWYRALLAVERDLLYPVGPPKPGELLARLNEIEEYVSKIKVPASFADQYYTLRGHIKFVRTRLEDPQTP
ncbi:MAG: TAXI family TRAP transporter solute-binding subunit [Limisphaerales bacterium]